MNILNFSLILANAALLASAAEKSNVSSQILKSANSFLKSVSSATSEAISKVPDIGATSVLKATGNKLSETFNSLSNKSVKDKDSVTLERIMACSATGSNKEFVNAIKAYVNENATIKEASNVDNISNGNSDTKKKDTALSPRELAMKKLIVLFNCPKANALLAELTKDNLIENSDIPEVVREALKQKLLELPFGSLQFDYDRTIQACVKSINDADHGDICTNNPCTKEDLENLEKKLASLDYCSHHFMKDSIKKIVAGLKEDWNAKFDTVQISRSKFLGMITKIANTLPNIQIKTGNFLNEGNLENTNIKCRVNLQKLLNVSDVDVPSYEDLFKKDDTSLVATDNQFNSS